VELPPADDGATRWLWYWCYIDEQHGMYVRLNTSYAMQKFNPKSQRWEPMDGYYLKRATQDPEFIEITRLMP